MPAALPRRTVLIGAVGLAVLAATATACGGDPPPPEPDPLETQLELARRDTAMATAAAAGAPKNLVALFTVAASERADHAKALATEIARAADKPLSDTETSTPGPSVTTTAAPPPPPDKAKVIAALRESADSAAKLAPTLKAYRAGLVGSIAASCTTLVEVPFATAEPQQ